MNGTRQVLPPQPQHELWMSFSDSARPIRGYSVSRPTLKRCSANDAASSLGPIVLGINDSKAATSTIILWSINLQNAIKR